LESASVTSLLAMATDGVAMGRTATPELLKYLFARAAEQPELQQLLGIAADRASKVADPTAVLAGLIDGRRRLGNEQRKRSLRQRLQQAMDAGDRASADDLQGKLLDLHRQDQPRSKASSALAPSPSSSTNPRSTPAWLSNPPPATPGVPATGSANPPS